MKFKSMMVLSMLVLLLAGCQGNVGDQANQYKSQSRGLMERINPFDGNQNNNGYRNNATNDGFNFHNSRALNNQRNVNDQNMHDMNALDGLTNKNNMNNRNGYNGLNYNNDMNNRNGFNGLNYNNNNNNMNRNGYNGLNYNNNMNRNGFNGLNYNNDMNNNNRSHSYNYNTHVSKVERIVKNVKGVENAHVVMFGNTAIIGIDVNAHQEKSRVGKIKNAVAEAVSKDENGIKAIVTSDMDLVRRLQEVGHDITSTSAQGTNGSNIMQHGGKSSTHQMNQNYKHKMAK